MGLVTLDYAVAFGGVIIRDDIATADSFSLADAAVIQIQLLPAASEQFSDSVPPIVDAAVIDLENRPDLLYTFAELIAQADVAIPDLENRPDLSIPFAESIFFTDGLLFLDLGNLLFARLIPEVLSLQDSQQRMLGIRENFADTVTLTDSIKLPIWLSLTDTLTLTDSIKLPIWLSFTDAMTLQDKQLAVSMEFDASTLVETLSMSDHEQSNMVGTLTITTTSIPDATNGVPYSFQLQASGGTPPYTWSITSGTLPTGLSLASDGTISGTPTQTISLDSITFSVSDSG